MKFKEITKVKETSVVIPSQIPLLREIQWVMQSKKHPVTEREAEAIVDLRRCTVQLSFDPIRLQWEAAIFRSGQLILKKRSSLSHREGVSSLLWHFIDLTEKIPWSKIQRGEIWRTNNAILDYHFWLRSEIDVISQSRSLLLCQSLSAAIH